MTPLISDPQPVLASLIDDALAEYVAGPVYTTYDARAERTLVVESSLARVIALILWRLRVRATNDVDDRRRFVTLDVEDQAVARATRREDVLTLAATVAARLPNSRSRRVADALAETRALILDGQPGATSYLRRLVEESWEYLVDLQDPHGADFVVVWSHVRRPGSGRPQGAQKAAEEHLRVFLDFVPPGRHVAAEVWAEYAKAAEAQGVAKTRRPGRTTFYAAVDRELGPRLTGHARESLYFVSTHAEEPLDLATVLGLRPAPLAEETRAVLRRVLDARRLKTSG